MKIDSKLGITFFKAEILDFRYTTILIFKINFVVLIFD